MSLSRLFIGGGLGAIGLYIIIYVALIPGDELLFQSTIGYIYEIPEDGEIIKYIYPIEVLVSLIFGLIGSILIFIYFIFGENWRIALLRATDILWLLGAGATILFAATLLQEDIAKGWRDHYDSELARYSGYYSETLEMAPGSCDRQFKAPGDGASSQLKKAYNFVVTVCAALAKEEAEHQGKDAPGRVYAELAIEHCGLASIDYYPESAGPSYPDDLRAAGQLWATYQTFESFCFVERRTRNLKEDRDPLNEMLDRLESIKSHRETVRWFRLFALVLALRMTRGIFDVAGDIRNARRSRTRPSSEKP